MDSRREKKSHRRQLAARLSLEWTGENHLRHTKFIALRDDKPAHEVRREL